MNNPNAFPSNEDFGGGQGQQHPGMTTRDYFAAKAMQSILMNMGANPEVANNVISEGDTLESQVSKGAYLVADAMLKERAK